ncbi:MAG TPA: hypothetical protein VGR40_11545 [Candidatus Binatus sp.]|nr:hypothetical protein [Candidatus Binatus sp.]
MNWETFYLTCFLIGVTLSLLGFLGGSLHMPHVHFHVHVPHFHLNVPHAHIHVPHAGGGHAGVGGAAEMPIINFGTISAFLAWFGGTGYLLTRHSGLLATVIILLAIGGGLVGAAIIFWFIVKFLLTHDQALDPADYDMVGVLGRISSGVREGGTGEMIFSRDGTRQTCGARCEDGKALARGTEVVVTRYERGIAYVRRYEELADNAGEKTAG